MPLTFLGRLWKPRTLSAGVLILMLGGVAFLLACHDLQNEDVWWHLRGGEWILHSGRAPQFDPFTFSSADRPWIDLHWLFQMVLVLVYRAGGIPGMILLAAAMAAAAVLAAFSARPRGAPLAALVVVWLPALLLAADRFYVRPEMATLLFLGSYLAVLVRLDDQPRLAWLLPLIQVLWVNMHGLFVFGPIVLGLWLAERASLRLRQPFPDRPAGWWRHVGGASAAVALACLVNPYGLDGALHPLVLYGRVTDSSQPYKVYIQEFRTPREFARSVSLDVAGNKGCFCCFHFLLLLLPLSFLLPAVWQASDPSRQRPRAEQPPLADAGGSAGRSPLPWLALLGMAVLLLAANTLTLSVRGRPGSLVLLGQSAPWLLGTAGVAGSLFLWRCSRSAAVLALAGGIALAAWTVWLKSYLRDSGAAPADSPYRPWSLALTIALIGGIIAAGLILRHGGSLFHLGLAAVFVHLALSATNSLSRLGLVAGFLLSWNLAPWIGLLCRVQNAEGGRKERFSFYLLHSALCFTLLAWMIALLTHRAGNWFAAYPIGLREQPLTFAHDAARFAGQPDMPKHALVYDLVQACVYVFHSSAEHKVYMDARLEVPTPQTFQTYVAIEKWLQTRDPRALEAIHALGDPVVLLSHEGDANGEAMLLQQPGWRLVYFDALASVFVPPTGPEREVGIPTLDLAARHFRQPDAPSQPAEPGAAAKEGWALFSLSESLRDPPSAKWSLRIPILLAALDRAERAVREEPDQSEDWSLLGACHASLLPELRGTPASSIDSWDPNTGLPWAQATYCFRRACELRPDDPRCLQALYRSFALRRMTDAQRAAGERLRDMGQLSAAQTVEVEHLARLRGPARPRSASLSTLLTGLLEGYRPREAARVAEEAIAEGKADWDWAVADRLAGACMHLGRPDLARQVWRRAKTPPSEAVYQSRLADTFWVERDFDAAIRHYDAARRCDPHLIEPCLSLAWLHAERGNADAALHACRDCLALASGARLREELPSLQKLLRAHLSSR
jgi:tetratricopeptide (TPR) repeat protein